MKYSESYSGRGKKLGTGFYILIACCLLIIGGAAWFALSNYADNQVTPKTESNQNNSYNEDNNSYNNNTPDVPSVPEVSENVAQSVEKEPYSSEEATDNNAVSYSFTMPVEGEILKDFAEDTLVYSKTLEEWTTHLGIDIKAEKTSVVRASEKGKIESIKNDPRYGLTVVIEHQDGFKTVYSNLLTTEFVAVGDEVEKGQTIGTVGQSASFETLDESHLHFEMYKDGTPVNPTIYFK